MRHMRASTYGLYNMFYCTLHNRLPFQMLKCLAMVRTG